MAGTGADTPHYPYASKDSPVMPPLMYGGGNSRFQYTPDPATSHQYTGHSSGPGRPVFLHPVDHVFSDEPVMLEQHGGGAAGGVFSGSMNEGSRSSTPLGSPVELRPVPYEEPKTRKDPTRSKSRKLRGTPKSPPEHFMTYPAAGGGAPVEPTPSPSPPVTPSLVKHIPDSSLPRHSPTRDTAPRTEEVPLDLPPPSPPSTNPAPRPPGTPVTDMQKHSPPPSRAEVHLQPDAQLTAERPPEGNAPEPPPREVPPKPVVHSPPSTVLEDPPPLPPPPPGRPPSPPARTPPSERLQGRQPSPACTEPRSPGVIRAVPTPPSRIMVNMSDVAAVLQQRVERRHHFRRWVHAVVYFVLIVIVALMHTNVANAHYVNDALTAKFVTPGFASCDRGLDQVVSIDDLWQWLYDVWAPGVFADYSAHNLTETTQVLVANFNKVLVSPTLRMRRRSPTLECEGDLVPSAKAGGPFCYEGYSRAFISGNTVYTAIDGLTEFPEDGDDYYAVFRINSNSFGAGGGTKYAAFDILSLADARAALERLRADGWISQQMASLEAHLVVYNAEVDLLGELRIVFAVSRAGSVHPLAPGSVLQIRRMRMYNTALDRGRFVLELIFMIATFFEALFKYAHIRRARRRGASVLAYFTSKSWAWNWFEVLYVVVALAVFSVYVRAIVTQMELPREVHIMDGMFESHAQLHAALKSMVAILLALTGVKVVRHMGFLPGWSTVLLTLEKAVMPLAAFVAVLLVVCVGFACAGHYFFGTPLSQLASPGGALRFTLLFFIRQVENTQLEGPSADLSEGVFPPIFFWSMAVVMVFAALSLVTAIAVVSYRKAKVELAEHHRIASLGGQWAGLLPVRGWWEHIPAMTLVDRFPKDLLETFGRDGKKWLIPLMTDYPAMSKMVAEVAGGTLRLHLMVHDWFRRKLVGARGVAVVFPPGAVVASTRTRRGYLAKVTAGQVLHMTTNPLMGASEMEFVAVGNTLRSRGGLDLGTSYEGEVVIEFPNTLHEDFAWPVSEVMAKVDTVQRIAVYGGCFTHTPADWLCCAVGAPTALDTCPFLVREHMISLHDIKDAVKNSGLEQDVTGWNSVLALAQIFGEAEEEPHAAYPSPRSNPLDLEQAWLQTGGAG